MSTALPPELSGWTWQIDAVRGKAQLIAPDLAWRTRWYGKPSRAIAEAQRRVRSRVHIAGGNNDHDQ